MSDGHIHTALPSDDELLAMPKADLHVHLVGSAAPETVTTLAARHPEAGVPADLTELREFFEFRDFTHFLRVYGMVSALVCQPEDVVALVRGLASDLSVQGVGYAEVTITPTSHLAAGISARDLAAALDLGASRARKEQSVELAWVYDVNGVEGVAGAWRTLECALGDPPGDLVGFGIGGPEAEASRAAFADVFGAARAAGLHSVPHAGESVGPEEIWAAIDLLGAERVGHGIAAVHDDLLLTRLCEDGITLEVCPSSNVATGVVPSLAEHPLTTLIAAEVPVVLGSDDPPMFGTSLLEEYRRARDVLGLDRTQLHRIAAASIASSFASPALKKRLCRSQG
ncbi:MAG: adenosine deaminase [Acidimicrobiales bacterium]